MTVLFTHEIDSAYWKEWDLFGLGGGINVFLILNFVVILAAVYGYKKLMEETLTGYIYSLAIALSGIAAFCIHSYFLITGHPEFNTTVSKILLISILMISIIQGTFNYFVTQGSTFKILIDVIVVLNPVHQGNVLSPDYKINESYT